MTSPVIQRATAAVKPLTTHASPAVLATYADAGLFAVAELAGPAALTEPETETTLAVTVDLLRALRAFLPQPTPAGGIPQ